MKKKAIRPLIVALVLALFMPLAFSGCVVVAAAAAAGGTVAYVRGALKATLPETIDQVQKSTKQVIRNDLQLTLISASEDALTAQYVARTANDDKVNIVLTKLSDRTTKIEIRIGYFGDENLSRQILDAIKTRVS